jgi:hypothetical protein
MKIFYESGRERYREFLVVRIVKWIRIGRMSPLAVNWRSKKECSNDAMPPR